MAEESLLGRNQDVAEVNRSGWKLIVTIIVPVAVATGASYLFLSGHIIWSVVMILVLVNLIALQAFLLKTASQIWFALLLSAIALLVPFFSINLNYLSTAALVTFLFFAMGTFSARHELNNTLKISFFKITRKSMVGVITGIAGGITVLVVSGALGPTLFSADNMATYFVDPYVVAPSLQYALHQPYTPNETVRYFLTSQVESSPNLNNIPNSKLKDQLVIGAVDSSATQISSSLGVPLALDSSISVNLIHIMQAKVNQMEQPLQLIVVLSFYLALWSLVALLATIASYVLSVTAFLIFELLVLTNFAEIQMESRTHEIVTL